MLMCGGMGPGMGMDVGDMGDMGMGGGAGTGAMPVGTGWPINAQGRAVERCAAMAEEGARPALRAHRRTHRSTHPQRQLDVCNHCAQAQLMRQRTACPPFAQRGAWSVAIEHDMSSRRRLWHARRTSLGAACGVDDPRAALLDVASGQVLTNLLAYLQVAFLPADLLTD